MSEKAWASAKGKKKREKKFYFVLLEFRMGQLQALQEQQVRATGEGWQVRSFREGQDRGNYFSHLLSTSLGKSVFRRLSLQARWLTGPATDNRK